jgi:hypothetical protein
MQRVPSRFTRFPNLSMRSPRAWRPSALVALILLASACKESGDGGGFPPDPASRFEEPALPDGVVSSNGTFDFVPGPAGAAGCPAALSSRGRKRPLSAALPLAMVCVFISRSQVRHLNFVALAPVPLAPSAVSGLMASQAAIPLTD